MALPEENNSPSNKKPVVCTNKNVEKKEKLPTKIIIRRLPPQMNKETFLNQVSPVPEYDYFYMVRGDASMGENSFSRAYLNFVNHEDIFDFKEKFDNYVFVDDKGHEYPAVVEFAAFQRIPKKRNKIRVDPKCGTIETDPLYLEFIENLNKPKELEEKPEYSYQLNTENKNNITTPLLEFVKNRRAERLRIREERREERKRKELERKKIREDERRRRFEEKAMKPSKSNTNSSAGDTIQSDSDFKEKDVESNDNFDDKPDKYEKPSSSYYKNRDRKFEDRKKEKHSKYPVRKEYVEKREFKRRDDYKDRNKFDDYKKYDDYKKEPETKQFPKKVKKYSEKREERKIEAQKAEQKKVEEQRKESVADASLDSAAVKNKENANVTKEKDEKIKEVTTKVSQSQGEGAAESRNVESKNKERIRNKDRPTIAIYRPGMLSKRKQVEGETENKDSK